MTTINTSGQRDTFFTRLYTGTGAFDIVGKRKRLYIAMGLFFLICVSSMVFRGFHWGIEFEGGTKLQFPVSAGTSVTQEEVKKTLDPVLPGKELIVQSAGSGDNKSMLIRSSTLTLSEIDAAKKTLFEKYQPKDKASGQPSIKAISDSAVSESWGSEITGQALIALLVFMVLVTIFLAAYFEKWMAVSALITLIHDISVTAGVYSLIGFEVTPSTIIGLLTILGFSLYDTVVVFDKVRENTRGILGLTRRTYAEAANLAVNQTLMRSINTTLIALLPVLGLLIVGAGVLGVGTLKDLALIQLTGMLVGAFSSICLATPLLVDLKLTEKPYQDQARRVLSRRASAARKAAEPDSDASDDQELTQQLRRESAYAASSGVPGRVGKGPDSRRTRPAGKSGRPTGKRGR
ncbi:protein translocase subunit SecF [Pseudonocardiaceae bacterium YIM PH 21723]|nr:protein translocase subunit SecF [Pseudonocardiaceae bacterium YIM PH 21723]